VTFTGSTKISSKMPCNFANTSAWFISSARNAYFRGIRIKTADFAFKLAAVRVFCGDFETHSGIDIKNHLVFCGGGIDAEDFGTPFPLRQPHDFVHHFLLHLPLEDAAAHQPGVDLQCLPLDAADHDGDQPVVAEPILKTH